MKVKLQMDRNDDIRLLFEGTESYLSSVLSSSSILMCVDVKYLARYLVQQYPNSFFPYFGEDFDAVVRFIPTGSVTNYVLKIGKEKAEEFTTLKELSAVLLSYKNELKFKDKVVKFVYKAGSKPNSTRVIYVDKVRSDGFSGSDLVAGHYSKNPEYRHFLLNQVVGGIDGVEIL